MYNYNILATVFIVIFVLTVSLIYLKRITWQKFSLALFLISILMGSIADISWLNIAKITIQNFENLIRPAILYFLSVMIAGFIFKYNITVIIDYLYMYYFSKHPIGIIWFTALMVIIISSVMMNTATMLFTAVLFVPSLINWGIDKYRAVMLILLSAIVGVCFNVDIQRYYVNLLGFNLYTVDTFYKVIAFFAVIMLTIYVLTNVNRKKLKIRNVPKRSDINLPLSLVLILPFLITKITSIPLEISIIISLIYGVFITKKNIIILINDTIRNSCSMIALLFSIGLFTQMMTRPEISKPIAWTFIHFIPIADLPTIYLVAFTVLSILTLYRGPFSLQGLGAGFSSILVYTDSKFLLLLGLIIMSFSFIYGIIDPFNEKNILLFKFFNIDIRILLRRLIPYIMILCYFILFYVLIWLR